MDEGKEGARHRYPKSFIKLIAVVHALCFAISAAGRHHAGFKPTRLRAQSARLHHHMMASSQNSAALALIHQDFSTM